MCIAILSKENTVIPLEHLQESFRSNPDGAGFMYAENEQLYIEKGFMDFNSFYAAYKPHEDKACAVHFRIKTHGAVDQENTHPFRVGHHLGMIHNGIINNVDTSQDKSKSDTFWFNQKILVPIYKKDSRFIFKEHFKELITEYIGWSKLVFLNNKGHYTIVNEEKGHWDEGIWYSNRSYQETRKSTKKIEPFKEEKKQEIFVIGDRVEVRYEFNKANNGFGVVEYFSNGNMVGVKMDGQESARQIYMGFVYHAEEEKKTFEVDDWVVRKDNPEMIGEVKGLAGNGVIVWWLNPQGTFTGPNYVVNADKLEHWWDTNAEEYMQ